MKLEQLDREVISSGAVGKVYKATVAASRKVFDMFADSTYANKEEAIARELVANGIDAQGLNGMSHVPIEVVLPTEIEPVFIVKDRGPGMSEEFVTGPFMAFTDGSTKDGSDDAIGGFGIGSKSPLSYVDQFTLRVVHDGILSVYTLFRDEGGIPSIALQAQTTTDEHSGVQVSFPVETPDIPKFVAAAQNALQYFNPLPVVENGTLTGPDYQYVGNNWAMRREAGPLGIVMGGVRYPVVTNSLSYELRSNTKINALLDYGLDLTLPIGAVPIAMSREQLQYVAKTSEVIGKAVAGVLDDVVATFSTIFDSAPSLWEAVRMLAKEAPESGSYTARGRLLAANAKYKGEKLERTVELFVNPKGKLDPTRPVTMWEDRLWVIDSLTGRRRRTVGSSSWQTLGTAKYVHPARYSRVIVDDLPQKPSSKALARIRAFVEDAKDPLDTIVLRPEDGDVDRILAVFHNPSDYVLTSSMPMPVTVKKTKNVNRPRVRMYQSDGQKQRTRWGGQELLSNLTLGENKPGVTEIEYKDQPSTGILIVMSSFEIPNVAEFHKNMASGLIDWDEIYFVNSSDGAKIKANFVDFFEEHARRLKKALAAYPDLPARIALSANQDLKPIFELWKQVGAENLKGAQLRRPFGVIGRVYEKYVASLDSQQRRLAAFIKPDLPKGIKPDELVKSFYAKQPDAALLSGVLKLERQDHLNLFIRSL